MQLIDGAPVYSATDLVGFLACAHRFELERAAMVGLVEKPIRRDPAIDLVQKRGFEHEARFLAGLEAAGRTVVRIQADGSAVDPALGASDGPAVDAAAGHAATANGRARDPGRELRGAAEETRRAMDAGADVVYQATFFDGTWRGHADFLLRVAGPSALGDWHYEVADTKLARHVKAGAVLQICSYVDQLTRIQGVQPRMLHVALGGSAHETVSLRVDDYMAYYRQVKADFLASAAATTAAYPPSATYPEPVEHCDVCRWWAACRDRRRADDDLSLVAGISGRQRASLKGRAPEDRPGPVRTRRGLAGLELPIRPRLEGVSTQALERVQAQARIQVAGEDAGQALWELLEPERTSDPGTGVRKLVPDRGFLVLPEPSPNDLFLDLEGDPFAFDDGIDYLFGLLEPRLPDQRGMTLPDGSPAPRFHAVWSRDERGEVTLAAEKAAFERLVDLLIERLDADPSLHVYHYAAYEKTALARLAQRHGTREEEVDRLLRGRVLVDLYRVVRQGIRASVESYSIKRLEPLYGLLREVELKSAGTSIVAFEAWLGGGATEEGRVGEEILAEIEGYNRDDVLSNWRLRDWLEARRVDLAGALGEDVPRPPREPAAEEPTRLTPRQERVAAVVERLTAPLAGRELGELTGDERATWLLAQLLGWHRREDKAFWWRYFDLCGKTDEELVDEREPLGQVELVEDLGETGRGGRLQRFRFPAQDHGVKPNREVNDPRTRKTTGWVVSIDEGQRAVVLKRSAAQLERGRPRSLIPNEHVATDAQEESLLAIGEWVAERGIAGDGPHRAARELLLRRPPRLAGGWSGTPLRAAGEPALSAATRLATVIDESTLAIQGPPGTGKTWTGARMILALVGAGRKVGVTANSHKVIGHVLDEVFLAVVQARGGGAPAHGREVRIGQKTGTDGEPTSDHATPYTTNEDVVAALARDEVDVVGGTAWLWSRAEMAGSVDVLVVDEAGQMSLANTVAVSPAARSLVLLGDPQQLDQPLKGSHPPGAERSALAHLLAGDPGGPSHATMPPHLGLFIEKTWRLHPAICAYTSEVFYEGKLESEAGRERQELHGRRPFDGAGIRWLPVAHAGNDVDSREEAAAIVALLVELLDPTERASWTDADGITVPLRQDDVVIVAPYNAHVERIGTALREAGLASVRVGTVDKLQGQQAPLAIYAMGSSSPEDAPRGMAFLYSLNRLNVATSRARCVAAVVASPSLVQVACRTPGQMRLANALCRLVEVAE